MFYFYLWVLFLLTVMLAVPITAWADKRKHRALQPEPAEFTAEPAELDADDQVEFGEQQADQEVAEFEEIGDAGDEELPDFEDFK